LKILIVALLPSQIEIVALRSIIGMLPATLGLLERL
jgi:hypothetical protein